MIQREMITIDALAHHILCTPGIEGVTYTGGEPMLQAGALAELGARVRAGGLSVVCYTGYTLDELRDSGNPHVAQLLAGVDVLIDGPYMPEQAGYALWRGSRNQKVHFLTDRYADRRGLVESECADAEFSVDAMGLTATGIWPDGLLERLREHMGK